MKYTHYCFLLLSVLLTGCNYSEPESPALSDDEPQIRQVSYVNVFDTVKVIDSAKAQSVASAFTRLEGGSRSVVEKSVESIIPIKSEDGSIAMYAVNYSDNGGYYFDPDEWPENHAYIKKRGCITDLHKK